MAEDVMSDYFRLFNEIGIIGQLSRSILETRLPPGFVLAQFSVLNHLVRVGDARTPVAIARALQVSKTSMTHSLAVLEREGLIEIRKNPQDGRSKLVYISDAGRKFRQDTIDSLAPDLTRIAPPFPPTKWRGCFLIWKCCENSSTQTVTRQPRAHPGIDESIVM